MEKITWTKLSTPNKNPLSRGTIRRPTSIFFLPFHVDSTIHKMLCEGFIKFSLNIAKGNEHVFKIYTVMLNQAPFVQSYFCTFFFFFFPPRRQSTKHCFTGQKEYFVVHFTALLDPGEDDTPKLGELEYSSCQLSYNCLHLKVCMGATLPFTGQHQWKIETHGGCTDWKETKAHRAYTSQIEASRTQRRKSPDLTQHCDIVLLISLFHELGNGFCTFLREEISPPNWILVTWDRRKALLFIGQQERWEHSWRANPILKCYQK